MLFIDFSSAFNTIVPSKLINKLRTLGLNTYFCSWILDFLTGRPRVVRVGNNTSATLILNTGAPRGWVLSLLTQSWIGTQLRIYAARGISQNGEGGLRDGIGIEPSAFQSAVPVSSPPKLLHTYTHSHTHIHYRSKVLEHLLNEGFFFICTIFYIVE